MIGGLGRLSIPFNLTPQCRQLRRLILEDGTDQNRLNQIAGLLNGTVPIEEDSYLWLTQVLRGHIGVEGYMLDVSDEEQVRFWHQLSQNYPTHARLQAVLADVLLLAKQTELSLQTFLHAFQLDPLAIYEQSGDVADAFAASPYRLQYDLCLLRAALLEGDCDEIDELLLLHEIV